MRVSSFFLLFLSMFIVLRREDHLEDIFEFAYVDGRLPVLRRLDLGREISCCSSPHEVSHLVAHIVARNIR
jgi:hypothetical protein